MSTPNFTEMVNIARCVILENQYREGLDCFERDAGFHAFLKKQAPPFLSLEFARDIYGWSGSPFDGEPHHFSEDEAQRGWREYSESVVEAANASPDGFNRLCHLSASMIEQGSVPHPVVAKWLAAYLRGEVTAPKERGRPRASTHDTARDDAIRQAVQFLIDHGATATRNETSPPQSACDAVAEAMRLLNLKPASFGAIQNIWANRPSPLSIEIFSNE